MPERKLFDILDQLEKDNSYDRSSSGYVDKFRLAAQEQSKQYLNQKVKKATQNLILTLNSLRKFIDENFIVFPKAEKISSNAEKVNKSVCMLHHPKSKICGYLFTLTYETKAWTNLNSPRFF